MGGWKEIREKKSQSSEHFEVPKSWCTERFLKGYEETRESSRKRTEQKKEKRSSERGDGKVTQTTKTTRRRKDFWTVKRRLGRTKRCWEGGEG